MGLPTQFNRIVLFSYLKWCHLQWVKMDKHYSLQIAKDASLRSRLKGFPEGPCPGMKLAVSYVLEVKCLPKTRKVS